MDKLLGTARGIPRIQVAAYIMDAASHLGHRIVYLICTKPCRDSMYIKSAPLPVLMLPGPFACCCTES